MRDNPSLQPELVNCLSDAYEDARYGAVDETGLPLATFPEACPYLFEQVIDLHWLP